MRKPMPEWFKDREHLFRMAGLFLAGILAFFILQGVFVPQTFGRYGHYRAAAIDDARAKPLVHAGRAACIRCHAEQATVHHGGAHARLGCEACHGALGAHARQPRAVKVQLPDTKVLCAHCHAKNVARPGWFKQVDVDEHSSGEACNTCHRPHDPKL